MAHRDLKEKIKAVTHKVEPYVKLAEKELKPYVKLAEKEIGEARGELIKLGKKIEPHIEKSVKWGAEELHEAGKHLVEHIREKKRMEALAKGEVPRIPTKVIVPTEPKKAVHITDRFVRDEEGNVVGAIAKVDGLKIADVGDMEVLMFGDNIIVAIEKGKDIYSIVKGMGFTPSKIEKLGEVV